jgi:hypothetical protein
MDDGLHMHAANRDTSSWGDLYDRLRLMRVGWWHASSPQPLIATAPQPEVGWGTLNARGRGGQNWDSLRGARWHASTDTGATSLFSATCFYFGRVCHALLCCIDGLLCYPMLSCAILCYPMHMLWLSE